MKRSDFGSDFQWGTAAAAYQIEGAWDIDGKGESIWDRFSHTAEKIARGETGDTACDHYHRFADDIGLMRGLRLLGSAEGVKEEIHAIRSRRGQHHPLVQKMRAAAAAGTDG